MATGRLPDPNTAPVTAKGDLYTYSTVPAKLAVGNDGETLVADSASSTGLRWNPHIEAGKNFIINGGFDIFQRGSFTSSSPGYSIDRWYATGTASYTISQQTTGVPVGSQYCARVAYNATTVVNFYQYIESGNVKMLQGRTVTVSAKLRRNSSFTAAYSLGIYKSTTANGGPSASWTQVGATTISNANLPTGTTSSDWVTATLTVTIPTDGTAEGLAVFFFENASQSSGAYVEIAQVQLEVGSTVTAFSRAGGTLAGELAACQRYFLRLNGAAGTQTASGYQWSATASTVFIPTPVALRGAPSLAYSALADFSVLQGASGVVDPTALAYKAYSANGVTLDVTIASGGSRGYAQILELDSTSATISLSSEL